MEPHPASRRRLLVLVEANELCDVWRTLHAELRQYTWTHFKDHMLSLARLDRLYVFNHHCSVLSQCFMYTVGFTDHCMVQCAVRKPRVKTWSGYWLFNTALLDYANFRDDIPRDLRRRRQRGSWAGALRHARRRRYNPVLMSRSYLWAAFTSFGRTGRRRAVTRRKGGGLAVFVNDRWCNSGHITIKEQIC
ncbi:hypothetical protein NFI96_009369 [Prochilodus magdalenae]|nr:hypothetical protein NFI96_009369 [Prochilodus magdalenae]